jgi:hypothetical protein
MRRLKEGGKENLRRGKRTKGKTPVNESFWPEPRE